MTPPAARALRRTSLVAALASAIGASLCCIGPAAAGLLGLAGAGSFAVFHEYRPYLAIGTIALLWASVGLTYRKRSATCCATGTDSRPAPPDPLERRGRVVLWVIVGLTLAVLTLPWWFSPLRSNWREARLKHYIIIR